MWMVEYYKTLDGVMTKLDGAVDGCWINLVKPTSEEINSVIENLNVDQGFMRAALDPEETSRVEVEDDQILLIVDIPTVEQEDSKSEQKIYATLPMGIIVAENAIITVCLHNTSITREIANGKVKGIHTAMKTRFIFQVLLRVASRYLNYLRRIERSFTQIERRLYESLKNEELIQLLGLSKSLVYFSASLKANEVTMEKVLRGRVLKLYEDDRDLLEDGLIEFRQAIEMANIYSSILSGTMDAYASVVSNNLNIIMKVLTVITIIMTIPNVIFSFYGMNVQWLPGNYFWFPILLSVAASIVAWIFLKKRNLY